MKMEIQRRWMSPVELSEYLGLSLGHIRNQLAQGGIYPAVKIGGVWRIDRKQLDEDLESKIVPTTQAQVSSWDN